MQQGTWSQEEHDRFLAGVKIYPDGPWRLIARYVGTRSVRQVQTHAQKYHEKIARRMRGLRKERRNHVRKEHRIDGEIFNLLPPAAGSPGPQTEETPAPPNFPFNTSYGTEPHHLGGGFQFTYDERAHADTLPKFPTIHLPPLRLAMPVAALDRDELPEEPALDYLARSMSNDHASVVV